MRPEAKQPFDDVATTMFEIIPNWHPLLVHFPIALIGASALFGAGARLARDKPLAAQWATVTHWTLWLGTLSAFAAAAAGWHAFDTVQHDQASHGAMVLHRNWALSALAATTLLAILDGWQLRAKRGSSSLFLAMLFGVFTAVGVTGWLGADLVYRHGLGVMRLPETTADGDHRHGDHSHGDHPHGEESQRGGAHTH